jgi:hydroxyacylglutathione hydrolase
MNDTMPSPSTKPELFIKTFPVGPLQCNCTIIGNLATREALVIDPGGDADKIMQRLQEEGLSVTRILHTHAHFDHFLASGDMHEKTGAPLCLHADDKPLWLNLETQCSLFNIPYKPVPEPQHWLAHDEELTVGTLQGKALFTPGHTPGSMSFWFQEAGLLIAGDTLFRGSVGRTDLWGGDYPTIERSIRNQLYTLDERATVITGHGPSTTIGHEIRHNSFIRGIT